ncbi:MAG: protein translocase subunit SecD [Proteobacteria bacterium]|nr:protein translocase subunit SecD [Pseudomonadota bacterium]
MSQPVNRPPNSHSLGRYLLILFVVVLGAIYAAPNLYQPDPALQIRLDSSTDPVDPRLSEVAVKALQEAGLAVKSTEPDGSALVIRMLSHDDQRHGREIVETALNVNAQARYVVALNDASTTPQWLRDIGAKPISLGLDLSGGVHFMLQVDMEVFLGDRMSSSEETVRDLLRDARIRYTRGDWISGTTMDIPFSDTATRDQAEEILRPTMDGFDISTLDRGEQPVLRLILNPDRVRELEDLAISQNLSSLRNRVNELGVSEPLVQRLGRERIIIDLPGVQDPARAKSIINKFANLEFRLVALANDRASQTETYEYEGRTVTLVKKNIVSGDNVSNAQQDFDPESGLPQVSITLDNDGGRRMNDVTKDRVGQSMAILFKELKPQVRTVKRDGVETVVRSTKEEKRVINVARINDALGFRFRITGLELGEARDLSLLLRAGALAAPMYIVEERTVGASLGDENIKKGWTAVLMGFVLVLTFMLFFYKGFGLAANIALAANLVLILAIMSLLGATLTLPGIAGIVLTVGMAVDANVLIFSRIKEELLERSPQQAIQAGFDRALLTIVDANVTTFFVAIILLSIGSGPVKGFAITLAVGIVTSVFTAIMGTRALVNLMYGGRKMEKLAI